MSAMRVCDEIQQDIAAGGALAEAEAAHVEHCERCGPIAETAVRARALLADPSPPPATGFVDRAAAGGVARQAAHRRRRRALGAGGAVAACGLAALLVTGGGEKETPVPIRIAVPAVATPEPMPVPVPEAAPRAEIDALMAPVARWEQVEEPLAAYRWLAEADSTGGKTR